MNDDDEQRERGFNQGIKVGALIGAVTGMLVSTVIHQSKANTELPQIKHADRLNQLLKQKDSKIQELEEKVHEKNSSQKSEEIRGLERGIEDANRKVATEIQQMVRHPEADPTGSVASETHHPQGEFPTCYGFAAATFIRATLGTNKPKPEQCLDHHDAWYWRIQCELCRQDRKHDPHSFLQLVAPRAPGAPSITNSSSMISQAIRKMNSIIPQLLVEGSNGDDKEYWEKKIVENANKRCLLFASLEDGGHIVYTEYAERSGITQWYVKDSELFDWTPLWIWLEERRKQQAFKWEFYPDIPSNLQSVVTAAGEIASAGGEERKI